MSIEKENLDHQTNNTPEDSSDKMASKELLSSENEVTKVVIEPKKWRIYFLEFFMLFLAVSMGFFAENIRESLSDAKKEKEYITSMIEDVKTDKINIKTTLELNNSRAQHLDSLAYICMNYNPADSLEREIYRHYVYGLIHPHIMSPTERTIQQLKNAGGMRLIKNKKAIDIILLYDDKTKKLANQQVFYEKHQNNSILLAVKLFNFQKFHFGNPAPPSKGNDYFKLIETTDKQLIEFGNTIFTYGAIVKYYTVLLQELNTKADDLIEILEKEYALK